MPVWFSLAIRETELFPLLQIFSSFSLIVFLLVVCLLEISIYLKLCDIGPMSVVSKLTK